MDMSFNTGLNVLFFFLAPVLTPAMQHKHDHWVQHTNIIICRRKGVQACSSNMGAGGSVWDMEVPSPTVCSRRPCM